MKRILLLFLLLFFVSSTAAYNFGTFTYQTSKDTTNRNVSFQLGLINPENSNLDIQLTARGLENGEVVFPENKFVLKPTEVSKNPEGDGWISVAPGKYAKVEKRKFWVIMDKKIDEDFKVSVRAEKSKPDDSGIKPKAVQIRDYSYSIRYPEEETFDVSRGYQRDEDSDDGLKIVDSSDGDSDKTDQTKSKTSTKEEKQIRDSSETSKTNETSTSKQEGGLSGMTLLLSVGAAGSLIYLWTVI